MALINVASREIHGKIVYYGPGLCGKTTNLQYIHGKIPEATKGELLSIATETERTLFFDFLPLAAGLGCDGSGVGADAGSRRRCRPQAPKRHSARLQRRLPGGCGWGPGKPGHDPGG